MKHKIVLMLGSNQGDRAELLKLARARIAEHIGEIVAVSTVLESDPMGYDSDNRYLNQALVVHTAMQPMELLAQTQSIEQELGRVRSTTQRYTDRTIDIDILYYDDMVVDDPMLKIPHPRISEREFVLIPLNEIVPELADPISGQTVTQMLVKVKKSTI